MINFFFKIRNKKEKAVGVQTKERKRKLRFQRENKRPFGHLDLFPLLIF